jgi:hypothetical protein
VQEPTNVLTDVEVEHIYEAIPAGVVEETTSDAADVCNESPVARVQELALCEVGVQVPTVSNDEYEESAGAAAAAGASGVGENDTQKKKKKPVPSWRRPQAPSVRQMPPRGEKKSYKY